MTVAGSWRKLGLVFKPNGAHPWMMSHAANPVAESRSDGTLRVYFGTRDAKQRSSVGWVDLTLEPKAARIVRVADAPVVVPGDRGLFDDSGVSMAWLVEADGRRYLYYVGWNLGVTVPWRNSIGLAIAEPGEDRFVKHTRAPIIDRNEVDPFTISYPCVLREGSRWRMWYGTNLAWGTGERDMSYVIKYAESADGIHWDRQGIVAIPLKGDGESALARPCVVRDKDAYRMWYSYRGANFRIGYAESQDGIHWVRQDSSPYVLEPSADDWDSEMIEYPFVFDHNGHRYMMYNGNSFGHAGFGVAVWNA